VPDEAVRLQKFQLFEQVVVRLVNLVVKRAQMEDTIFLALNRDPALSSDFEDFFNLRKDWANLLSGIAKSCGPFTIY